MADPNETPDLSILEDLEGAAPEVIDPVVAAARAVEPEAAVDDQFNSEPMPEAPAAAPQPADVQAPEVHIDDLTGEPSAFPVQSGPPASPVEPGDIVVPVTHDPVAARAARAADQQAEPAEKPKRPARKTPVDIAEEQVVAAKKALARAESNLVAMKELAKKKQRRPTDLASLNARHRVATQSQTEERAALRELVRKFGTPIPSKKPAPVIKPKE